MAKKDKGIEDLANKLKASHAETTSQLENVVASGDADAEVSASAQLDRLKESVSIEAEGLETLKDDKPTKAEDGTITALQQLSATLKESTDQKTLETGMKEFEGTLSRLEGTLGVTANENTEILRSHYEKSSSLLQQAILDGNKEAISIAEDQLEALNVGAESEEKAREAAKLNAEANSTLLAISNGISALGTKFDGITKSLSGGGMLVGLGALAFALFDPVKFAEVVTGVIKSVIKVFKGIIAIFNGDVKNGVNLLKDNIGTVAGMVLGAALLFGGPILGVLGGITTGIGALVKGFAAVKLFMTSTLLPAFAPVMLPILAIGAAIALLGVALDQVGKALGFNGIGDMLKLSVAYLQDGLNSVINLIGDIVNGIVDLVQKYGGRLASFLGFDMPDLSGMKMEKLDTNNGSKLAVELREKETARKAEEVLKESDAKVTDKAPTLVPQLEPTLLPQAIPTKGFELNNVSEENTLSGKNSGSGSVNNAVSNVTSSQNNTSNSTTYVMPNNMSFTEKLMNMNYGSLVR